MTHILHLENPAAEWENTTPVGCGNLGAALYGTVAAERIQLNEEWIWAGGPPSAPSPELGRKMRTARDMLLRGENDRADEWVQKHFDGLFGGVGSYEPAGELCIGVHPDDTCTAYSRDLDLHSGVARVRYRRGGAAYERELFASYPKNVIVCRLAATGAALDLNVTFTRESGLTGQDWADGRLTVHGQTTDAAHRFTVQIQFRPEGGHMEYDAAEERVVIRGAAACVFLIAIGTEGSSRRPLPCLNDLPDYDALRRESAADVAALMQRSAIELGDDSRDALPVNERLAAVKAGASDPALAALYFEFGKYLLVSSGRPGTLPANLQGVWNPYLHAPWNSDYHTNINLQMNYWPCEVTGLSECADPLFDYMLHTLLPAGKEVAAAGYGCGGTVLHHLSDPYGFSAPADGPWGLWPMGAAWLCYHLWEHWLFGGDEDFLRKTAYPYIAETVTFFLDYVTEKDGRLVWGPSASPENAYLFGGRACQTCLCPTMDVELLDGLFRMYIEAEKRLGIDKDRRAHAEAALKKLPPLAVGRYGQLCEWAEDYEEAEPGHRHISHAFALYPGFTITKEQTPALFEAVRVTVARRLAHGGGHTGWSAAWLVALQAHLLDGDAAGSALHKLLTQSTKDNLFDSHPPFQIDGNLGGCAAIAEMLLQSRDGLIRLLPAPAPAWQNGRFRGLMARGGFEIDAGWADGRVCRVAVKSHRGGEITLLVNGQRVSLTLAAGERRELDF